MAKAASSVELKRALTRHLQETKQHAERLGRIFGLLHRAAARETNHAVSSLTSEGERLIKHVDRSALLDSAIVSTGTQVEHYEIAVYGTMRAQAIVLGLVEAAELLGQTLTEEKAANRKLTEIAANGVNQDALGIQNLPKGIVVI